MYTMDEFFWVEEFCTNQKVNTLRMKATALIFILCFLKLDTQMKLNDFCLL